MSLYSCVGAPRQKPIASSCFCAFDQGSPWIGGTATWAGPVDTTSVHRCSPEVHAPAVGRCSITVPSDRARRSVVTLAVEALAPGERLRGRLRPAAKPGTEIVLAPPAPAPANANAATATVTISTTATTHGTSAVARRPLAVAPSLPVALRSRFVRGAGRANGSVASWSNNGGDAGVATTCRMRIGVVDHAREQQRAGRRQRVGRVGERLAHRARVGIAIVGLDRPDAIDHRFERSELLGRDQRTLRARGEHAERRVGRERKLPGDRLDEHERERIEIGARVELTPIACSGDA